MNKKVENFCSDSTIQRLHIGSIVNKFEPSKKICPSVKCWTTLFDCKKTFHSSEKMHPSVKSWTIFFSEADTRFQILESGVSVPLLPCTTPKKAHRQIFPTQLYIDSTYGHLEKNFSRRKKSVPQLNVGQLYCLTK